MRQWTVINPGYIDRHAIANISILYCIDIDISDQYTTREIYKTPKLNSIPAIGITINDTCCIKYLGEFYYVIHYIGHRTDWDNFGYIGTRVFTDDDAEYLNTLITSWIDTVCDSI